MPGSARSLLLATGVKPITALTVTYKGEDHINNQSSGTFTFAGKALGTASADRHVFVLWISKNTTARTLNSLTIGGVTATLDGSAGVHNQTQGLCGIAHAVVPSGATGDIVLTFSGGFTADVTNGTGIDWFTVVGDLNTSLTDSYTQNAKAEVTKTFSVPRGGVAFMIGAPTGNGTPARSVGSDFSTNDNYTQYIAGVFRYAGFAANSSTTAAANKAFASSNWVLSSNPAIIPVFGACYGVN